MTDISVVVPVYDAPDDYVETCVMALLRQELGALSYEIILVDDGSQERPLKDQLRRLGLLGHAHLRSVQIDHAGPATARNAGMEMARGELIAFTDIDCIPRADWLARYAEAFRCGGLDAAGGLTTPYSVESWVEQYCHHFGSLRTPLLRGGLRLLIACNACWRARALRTLGGFHRAYKRYASAGLFIKGFEDFELSVRAARHGVRVGVADDAVVSHRHRRTVGGRMQQFACYGAGYAAFVELCPDPPKNLTRYTINPATPAMSALLATLRQLARLPVRAFDTQYAGLPAALCVGYSTIDLLQRVAFYRGFCRAARQLEALSRHACAVDPAAPVRTPPPGIVNLRRLRAQQSDA